MGVVVIGGGTGSFVVLKGLKDKVRDLFAVVSMFDSGGSTGVLVDEFGILPPGDVRRCLVALADETSIVRNLFMFRFDERLDRHSFGNLFLTALTEITGSEIDAIKLAERVLHVRGRVLPVSTDHASLCAEYWDGSVVRSESKIDLRRDGRVKRVWLEPDADINEEVALAIGDADVIVIAPGDLFTSIIPNLLVKGLPEAISFSRAKKIYVCNLMTKPGETPGFTASDHVKQLIRYGFKPDIVLCNNSSPNPSLLAKYAEQDQFPVRVDADVLNSFGVSVHHDDIVSLPELVRHDPEKLAEVLLKKIKKVTKKG